MFESETEPAGALIGEMSKGLTLDWSLRSETQVEIVSDVQTRLDVNATRLQDTNTRTIAARFDASVSHPLLILVRPVQHRLEILSDCTQHASLFTERLLQRCEGSGARQPGVEEWGRCGREETARGRGWY